MARAVVTVPAQAKRGEIIEIKTLAGHAMETGFRRTERGELIPRDIITLFVCSYNGVEVFRAEMGSGISANPYLQFYTRAVASGELVFEWVDDAGERGSEHASITVTA